MPTKATNKSATPSKKPSAKPTEAGASSRSTAAPSRRGSKTAPVAEAPKADEEKPAAPAKPAEVLSLIDEKPVAAKRPKQEKAMSSLMPSISKLRQPEPVKTAPAPAPTPAPPVREEALSLIDPPKRTPRIAPVDAVVEVVPAAEAEAEAAPEDEKIVHLKPPIIVKDLATALGLRPFQVIKDLMEQNIFANINQAVETDVADKLCAKYGFKFEREKRHKPVPLAQKPVAVVEAPKEVEPPKQHLRAPIITFMGHVDHGKTSLMDHIRKARVAQGEAGGITQHIGAYSVEQDGQRITFLDTPGHAAFTAMRARGANVTDIVVLVVAADDGLMPQTNEAISHAKAANSTIVVAINKIDLPGANIDRVKKQLQEKGLQPEDWGGQTVVCPVSALKGTGIDHLLEMLLLQAEVMELKATPEGTAVGTVIEAEMEAGRGATGTIIVRDGTLKLGQSFICGNEWGKVKAMFDGEGRPMKEAGPAMPALVLGFTGLPHAGDEIKVVGSDREARIHSEGLKEELRKEKLSTPQRATLENLFSTLADGQKPKLNLVIKCDVQGSLEAVVQSLQDIDNRKVELDIIHAAVGPISENDVLLATASNAVVIGFNTKTENKAAAAAKREVIQIKLFSIIYELIDQAKDAMAGLLAPETRESVVGHAEVKKVFDLTKGKVAGCVVIDGRIARNLRARLLRGRQPIYDGGFATLQRFSDSVKEVRNGMECGIKLGDYSEYQVGDIIEVYQLEKIPQKL